MIGGSTGFQCAGQHGTAEEALKEIPFAKPDVVLMDIHLPGMSGIQCVRELKAIRPPLQIMMLTSYENADLLFESLKAGASGYLLKRTPPAKLLEAIEDLHRGGSPMSSQIARKVVQSFQQQARNADATASLTEREQEILAQLAKGFRSKEIAGALSISYETVRTHLRAIYDKLHVNSRTEAVLKYLNQ